LDMEHEIVKLDSKYLSQGQRGFKNCGNTCYLSSAIQALSSVHVIRYSALDFITTYGELQAKNIASLV